MKIILYLTDLYYEAKGRNYYEEDLMITGFLKDFCDVAICNPKNAEAFEDNADLIVFRNTGAVLGFQEVYDNFRHRVKEKNSILLMNLQERQTCVGNNTWLIYIMNHSL